MTGLFGATVNRGLMLWGLFGVPGAVLSNVGVVCVSVAGVFLWQWLDSSVGLGEHT